MMGLQEVREELLAEARKDSETVVGKAKAEAFRIMEDAKKQASGLKESALNSIRKSIEENERREIAAMMLEAKKRKLSEEKTLLEGAFVKARSRLSKLKQKEKEGILAKLLEKTKSEMEIGRIICNRADAGFFAAYNVEYREIVGLIAESKDGSISIDLSFDTQLDSLKEKHLQQFYNSLLR